MIPPRILADIARAAREGRAMTTFGAKVVPDTVFSKSSDLVDILTRASEGAEFLPVGEKKTWSVVIPTESVKLDDTTCSLWRFDETSGSTGADESPNDNNVTVTDAAWASGQFGNSLVFNGTTTKATCTFSSIEPIRKYMYVSCWVNPDTVSGTDPIVHLADTFHIYLDGGVLKAVITEGGTPYTVNSGLTVSTSSWQFISFQYRAGEVFLAVGDTVYKTTIAATEWTSTGTALTVGSDGSSYFDGKIDDLILEANVRIRDDWPVYDETAGHNDVIFWPFAENTGIKVHHAGLIGDALTISGGTWTTGYRRYAVGLDGIDDYGSCTPSLAESFSGITLSIEIGVRFDTDEACTLIAQTDGPNLSYNGTGIVAALGGVTNPNSQVGPLVIDTSTWYAVCVVYDGANKELWVNGQKFGEIAATGTAALTTNPLYVARNVAGDSFAHITVNHVRIYRARLKPFYRSLPYFMPGQNGFEPTDDWLIP